MSEGAELLLEGRRRYEAGDIADAEPLARRVLELRPPGSAPAARAEALQLAGEVAWGQGRYADAQALAEEAAELRRGGPDVDVAETDNLLGIIAIARGEPAAGLPLLEGALRMRTAALGEDAADTIETTNNIGAALDRLGRTEQAIALNREMVARCERAFAEPHRQLAVSLNALAVKLDRSPDTVAEAGRLYERALAAAEASVGPEHPMVATMVANLATQRLNAKDPEAARPLIARSIDLHERRHGPDHPNTATALFLAANLARSDGDPAAARALLERALRIRLAAFGPTDIRTRQVLVRLLTTLVELQSSDPATLGDAMLLHAVQRAVSPPPGVDPRTFVAPPPGPALVDQLRAYLERRAAVAGGDDPQTRGRLDRAAAALIAADAAFTADDLDVARAAFDEAIDQLGAARGASDPALVEPLHRRASLARADDRVGDAIADDERALEILGTAYGGAHPFVIRARSRLAVDLQREYGAAAARPVLEELRDRLSGVEAGGVGTQLRTIIDHHLARIPADAIADPIGRSTRRRRELAAGPPAPSIAGWLAGAAGRLAGSGPRLVREITSDVRLLASADDLVVADASVRLIEAVDHQGSLIPAAAAVVDPLLALAAEPALPHPTAPLVVLAAIVGDAGDAVAEAGRDGRVEPFVRALAERRGEVERLLADLARRPDPRLRAAIPGLRARLGGADRTPREPRRWN